MEHYQIPLSNTLIGWSCNLWPLFKGCQISSGLFVEINPQFVNVTAKHRNKADKTEEKHTK